MSLALILSQTPTIVPADNLGYETKLAYVLPGPLRIFKRTETFPLHFTVSLYLPVVLKGIAVVGVVLSLHDALPILNQIKLPRF